MYVYAKSWDDIRPLPGLLRPDGKRFFRSYGMQATGDMLSHRLVTLAVASKLKRHPHPHVAEIYEVFPTYFDSEVVNSDRLWNYAQSKAVSKRIVEIARTVKDHFQSLGIYLCFWEFDCFGLSDDDVIKFRYPTFSHAKYLGYESLQTHCLKEEAKKHGLTTPKELDDHDFDKWATFFLS